MKDEQKPQTDAKDALEKRLKKDHGKITKIEITGEEKQKLVAYLREPTLPELDGTLQRLSSAPISASVGLFRTVFVEGDKELLNLVDKAGYAIAVHKEIQKIIPNYETTSQTL